jgi:uncharacterized phage protein gp47/JayE
MDIPSRADLFQIGRSYVLDRATRIDPAKVDVQGSDVNVFVGSQSVVAYQLSKQLAYRTAALLLDSATGEDLDRLAWDRFQLLRKGASAALGTERFYRTSFALGAGNVPAGTVVRSGTGIEYTLITPALFGATQLDGALANVRASQAGKATQVGANALTIISNIGSLFDPTLQCNNDAACAGGEDPEDDDTFRNRIRAFWLTARRGILAAIEAGATSVPGVVSALAVESLNTYGQPARVVNLYISDSSGVASQALAQQVEAALDDYRAAGIAVIVFTSLPQLVDVVLSLTFQGGVDTISLTNAVQAAVVEFVNSLPVNGTLYVGQLFSVLQRFASAGLVPNLSSIVAPAGDLVPTLGQTLRTLPQNVTFTTPAAA